MSVPKFFEFFGPILDTLNQHGELGASEVRSMVADAMALSQEGREQMLPSGRQTTLANRVNWALTYLKKAGLVQSPARGRYNITPAGRTAFARAGRDIDLSYLEQSKEFREFRYGRSDTASVSYDKTTEMSQKDDTPEDYMESAFKEIIALLSDDILSAIMERSPAFFERLVVELLVRMGYGGAIEDAGKVVGRTSDEGIDGIIREDKLGFSSIYIQAKRWDPVQTVGRPEIQRFVGALAGQGATKGLFITTAQFSKEAVRYAQNRTYNTKVVLVDGRTLAKLMIENNLGVSPVNSYVIKTLDSDYFSADNE